MINSALEDPSTELGAAVAGWDYPADRVQLALLLAVGGEAAHDLLPFRFSEEKTQAVDSAEVEAAQADLESSIVFTSDLSEGGDA